MAIVIIAAKLSKQKKRAVFLAEKEGIFFSKRGQIIITYGTWKYCMQGKSATFWGHLIDPHTPCNMPIFIFINFFLEIYSISLYFLTYIQKLSDVGENCKK